jgi:hypothetical protein
MLLTSVPRKCDLQLVAKVLNNLCSAAYPALRAMKAAGCTYSDLPWSSAVGNVRAFEAYEIRRFVI